MKAEIAKDFAVNAVGEMSALNLGLGMNQIKSCLTPKMQELLTFFISMSIDAGLEYAKTHPEDVEIVYGT